MMGELNKKITEWLGKCWHNPMIVAQQADGFKVWQCRKCRESCGEFFTYEESTAFCNPDYTRDGNAMLELIEAVRGKGYHFDSHSGKSKMKYLVTFGFHRGDANTLPMAVAKAVEALIDKENEHVQL